MVCIRKIDFDIKWGDLEKIGVDKRKEVLRSICAINLKKTPGGHTTNRASFNTAIIEDKRFIQRQYDLYNPDITICCGTGWDFQMTLDLVNEEVYETSRGIKWYLSKQKKPVIVYPHPSARVQDSILVYGLIDAIREISNNNFLRDTRC